MILSYWDVLLVIWHFTLVNCNDKSDETCNDKSDAEMTTLWQRDSLNHVLCGGGTYAWCRDDTFTRFQTIWMIHKLKKKKKNIWIIQTCRHISFYRRIQDIFLPKIQDLLVESTSKLVLFVKPLCSKKSNDVSCQLFHRSSFKFREHDSHISLSVSSQK